MTDRIRCPGSGEKPLARNPKSMRGLCRECGHMLDIDLYAWPDGGEYRLKEHFVEQSEIDGVKQAKAELDAEVHPADAPEMCWEASVVFTETDDVKAEDIWEAVMDLVCQRTTTADGDPNIDPMSEEGNGHECALQTGSMHKLHWDKHLLWLKSIDTEGEIEVEVDCPHEIPTIGMDCAMYEEDMTTKPPPQEPVDAYDAFYDQWSEDYGQSFPWKPIAKCWVKTWIEESDVASTLRGAVDEGVVRIAGPLNLMQNPVPFDWANDGSLDESVLVIKPLQSTKKVEHG